VTPFYLFAHYLKYLFIARDKHSVHSPFVFNFYTNHLKAFDDKLAFETIERLRKSLKKNTTRINVTDFGAGSRLTKSSSRTIASIASRAEKNPSIARMIYRIVKFQQPNVILDLGTSLGLTTLYQSKAMPKAMLYSFEGCPAIAAIAAENFKAETCAPIHQVIGNIDETLPRVLSTVTKVDFVFFDANHRYEPTVRYFHQCLLKANEDSIFVFDDIYWSPEMKAAWNTIKADPSVGISIDLFYIGIIFFRKKQPPQHFTLR